MSTISNQYAELRRRAIEGEDKEKFDAFWFVYENRETSSDRISEALLFLRESAEAGNTNAQFNFGFLYATGEWVRQDDEAALRWLLSAVEEGHQRARLWAGMTYLNMYYNADNEAQKADYFDGLKVILREVTSLETGDTRISLAASEVLGRALLSESMLDEEGWELLKQSATKGYGPARETLLQLKSFLEEQIEIGFEDSAEPLLAELEEFLEKT